MSTSYPCKVGFNQQTIPLTMPSRYQSYVCHWYQSLKNVFMVAFWKKFTFPPRFPCWIYSLFWGYVYCLPPCPLPWFRDSSPQLQGWYSRNVKISKIKDVDLLFVEDQRLLLRRALVVLDVSLSKRWAAASAKCEKRISNNATLERPQ